MADIKISQLGAAVAVVDADVIPATANGVTVKVPASVLKEYAIGGTDISSIGDGTPTGAISALKSVKIEKTDIAPIETSVTSKAYAVGDQLYYNGMLYSVIAAIAQGETLVVDTNIELSDKVTEQIKALQGSVDLVNADLQKEVTTRAALGAHNLLPNTATDIVHNGVTFIVNDDGSVTVSGTPSATPGYGMVKICDIHTTELSGKSVIMGGGSNITAHCYVNIECFNSSNTRVLDKNIMTSEELFTIPADTIRIQCHIVVSTGFSGSSTAIYPMLRLATDADTTYQPYAMTNRELTELKTFVVGDSTYADALTFYKRGNLINVRYRPIKDNIPLSQRIELGTLPDEFLPMITDLCFDFSDPTLNNYFRLLIYRSTKEVILYRYKGIVGSGNAINTNGTFCYMSLL